MATEEACSELRMEDVFEPDSATEYEQILDRLCDPFVTAHASMYVFEKVWEFPDELLLDADGSHFLRLVRANFVARVVLVLANAFDPEARGPMSFERVKRWIRNHCRADMRDQTGEHLDRLVPDCGLAAMLKRTKWARDKVYAHVDWQAALTPQKRSALAPTFGELRALLEETERIVRGLSFGRGRSLQLAEYSGRLIPARGTDPRSDVERFLDLLAGESDWLKMPEQQPEYWPYHATNMSDEERELFNHWRKRIGCDPVDFSKIESPPQ